MLMRFIVANFGCFCDEATLSLIAGTDREHHPSHLITQGDLSILRTAGLYGANGHGKTKLVEALKFVQTLIVDGTKPNKAIPTKTFRLDAALADGPSRFEITFSHHDIIYEYGLVVDRKTVKEEWLDNITDNGAINLFQRGMTESETSFAFGPALEESEDNGFLGYVAKGTRPNQIFLNEAANRNVRALLPAFEWFRDVLVVIPAGAKYSMLISRLNKDSDFISFVSEFLNRCDTGIARITTRTDDVDLAKVPSGFKEMLEVRPLDSSEVIVLGDDEGTIAAISKPEESGKSSLHKLTTAHQSTAGDEVAFDIEDESSGTRQLINLLPVLFDLSSRPRVYVIDELERKLHPLLSYRFLEFFLNDLPHDNQGQIIFTTHNTHLLDCRLLRRDEIWFVEKRPNGSSDLYSLLNFDLPPAVDLEKGYLDGRFGAIPFFGNLRDLGWVNPHRRGEGVPCPAAERPDR